MTIAVIATAIPTHALTSNLSVAGLSVGGGAVLELGDAGGGVVGISAVVRFEMTATAFPSPFFSAMHAKDLL